MTGQDLQEIQAPFPQGNGYIRRRCGMDLERESAPCMKAAPELPSPAVERGWG